jgi:exopolysaccharide production protein ExoZ
MVVWVQILRAVAALAVMLAHAHSWATFLGIGDYVFDFPIGAAGVDLFFVISGFVMVQASTDLFGKPGASANFFLRRLARIAPIYWIATALCLYTDVYLAVGMRLDLVGMVPRNILTSLLFIPDPRPNGSVYPILTLGWTLNFEMAFYLAFSLALMFRARIGIPLLAVAIILCGEIASKHVSTLPFSYWFNPIIVEFAFGVLIGFARIEGFRLPNWLAALLAVAGLAWFAGSPRTFFWLPRELWWGLPAAAMVAGAGPARQDLDRRLPLAAFLVLLGDSSYALYLFHPTAMWLPEGLVSPTAHPRIFPVLMIASCIASAIAIHLLVERPITRRLQKLIAARFGYPHKIVDRAGYAELNPVPVQELCAAITPSHAVEKASI